MCNKFVKDAFSTFGVIASRKEQTHLRIKPLVEVIRWGEAMAFDLVRPDFTERSGYMPYLLVKAVG